MTTMDLPPGMTWLATQVAGHQSDSKKTNIRMIKTNSGCILKAGQKEALQARERSFYEKIKNSDESLHNELRTFIPKYYGTRELVLENKRIPFIILEDITDGMIEPCIMDIKIGKRTWDPLASFEKRAAEEKKYVESKTAYGFCIPGFQVYDLSSGDLNKFGKDYGKSLNKKTTVEALKMFLNVGENSHKLGLDKILLHQLINSLKKIESLFKKQNSFRFYSSSILIAYDAHCLRSLRQKMSPNSYCENSVIDDETNPRFIGESLEEINGLRVKMIDFTHVFEAEDGNVDINYLAGITSLVKLLGSLTR
ncbi:inositol polyphosphate multikinase [Diachasmimorpha longicaudata]|uniref:inositol polyphosphate multikinase n=1 Tax=Diachasmimorpha longicaudata TaxID=58733 RepID=UPI0030B8972A